MPVLIGASSDGASVNVAEHSGVRRQMQHALPWLFWSWCFSHRMELACKDSFVSAMFLSVQEMLLHLFYLYEKSPKKLRELTSIVDELEVYLSYKKVVVISPFDVREQDGSLTSEMQCSGWYILHLTELINYTSVKAADKARLKGYLKIWKAPKVLISCTMFFDALKPIINFELGTTRK